MTEPAEPSSGVMPACHQAAPMRVRSIRAGSVCSAFLDARREMNVEMQRLYAARHDLAPDPLDILACMLCAFSVDVLWSRDMRSASAAVLSTTPHGCNEGKSTQCSHVEGFDTVEGFCASLSRPTAACMSKFHARGIMHAAAQLGEHTPMFGANNATSNFSRSERAVAVDSTLKPRSSGVIMSSTTGTAAPVHGHDRAHGDPGSHPFIWQLVRHQDSNHHYPRLECMMLY